MENNNNNGPIIDLRDQGDGKNYSNSDLRKDEIITNSGTIKKNYITDFREMTWDEKLFFGLKNLMIVSGVASILCTANNLSINEIDEALWTSARTLVSFSPVYFANNYLKIYAKEKESKGRNN